MSQQLPTDWVVRAVGPDKKVVYFVVNTNAQTVAAEMVKNRLKVQPWVGWSIDGEPQKPNRL